jgi:hypothetical protein
MIKGIGRVTLRTEIFIGTELMNMRGKKCSGEYNIKSVTNINIQCYTKLNISHTSLTRILYVATLYLNRILHVHLKAPR